MSAFVNPELTEPLEVPCFCPPLDDKPRHEHDTVVVRSKLHYGDLQAISRAGSILGVWDAASATLKLMELGIVSWTFTDDDGKPTKPDSTLIRLLEPTLAEPIQAYLDARFTEASQRKQVPNASGGRSAQSSPATTPGNRASRRSTKR